MADISQETILTGDLAASGDLSDIVLTAPADGDILVRNGSNQWVNAVPGGGAAAIRTFKQTADVVTTAQEFNILTGMSASVLADTDYLVEIFCSYESSATNVGLGLGIDGPTTGSSPIEVRGLHWTNGLMHAINAYNDDDSVVINSEFNSNKNFSMASIIFRNGETAGTLNARGRCETSSGTTTFKIGSYMRITEL